MNKKIFIFILFIQLSGLVQSQPFDKICEREPCEEKNDSTSGNVTNVMSHANNVISRFSSLFKAVRSIGTSIYYIADVAVDIAEESTVDLFSAIKKDLSEMQTNKESAEIHDLITREEIAKPDREIAIGFGFEVKRSTNNSFIIKWTTQSQADWKLSINRHRLDKREEIKIPLGTTFYKIENVNEGDIIDIAFFDGKWHDTFQYEHRDSEISTTSEPVATGSPSRFGFKVERSTDNSFIVKWRRRSEADWKLLIDGVRPWKQRKEIKIPYGTTFYKIKYVNEGDIIDVTFFDGSWHEGFRYQHQGSDSSISSRSAATESAKDNSFKVERSTDNSFIVKWTRGSKADWKILIDGVRPYRQRETIQIPLGTTFYKYENVNQDDIIDVTFFDGSWHEGFRYQHQDSGNSSASRSAATGSSKDNSFKVERSTDNSFIVKWTRGSEADWKILIDGVRPFRQRETIQIPLGTTFYKIKYVNEGDIIDVTFFDGSWHEGYRYQHQDSGSSISSRSAASGSAASSPGFEVERSTGNSIIIKWTTQSQADWELNITRHNNPDKQETIKIPLGTTFYIIENVNKGDIIDIALFDGLWHKSFQYEHRESESSASSRSAAAGSAKDNSFKVERSTDNSFIVKWTRESGADWKLLIDGVRPFRQRETIQIPLGTTFYKYENVNQDDIIDVTFFDGSWHERFRYQHQDSGNSSASRSAATGSAKDNAFKVERSTDNSFIVKWTRGSGADWKLLIDGVRPFKQRETIQIPLGTTFYKYENVNEDDIIDVTFFDGSWHEGFRYKHQDSGNSSQSKSAATGPAKDNSFKVERSTDNSFIVKWTRGSGADWKLLIDGVRPWKPREEISIPPGTTFYKYENVNQDDVIDVTFFDGSWHQGFRYQHQDSGSSISSKSATTARDNSFKVERSADNSFIVKWTRGSGADWKLLIDGVRPFRQRETIQIPFGTTFYKYENVNDDDIIDVTFFDGSWHEGLRYEH